MPDTDMTTVSFGGFFGAERARIAQIEGVIRERVGKILDDLPRNEEFNWVDRVSIELTTQMLATLFDFPFEERHLLTYWSDMTTATPAVGAGIMPDEERRAILMECAEYFARLWMERRGKNVECWVSPEAIRELAEFFGGKE